MDALVSIGLIAAILLGIGLLLGLTGQKNFSPGWLVAAVLMVVANDAVLTNAYGLVPTMLPGSEWNWQGKALALLLSLLIAAHPALGWRRSGLTLKQASGSLLAAGVALGLYALFFLAIALAFPGAPATAETIAFQLTMPGIEEELFYRGILLLALNEAFRGRVRLLGVDWGWGALLSCVAFGLAHAFSWTAESGIGFDPLYFALTAIPSLLAVWMRERTGSLVLPMVAHNLGNSLPLLV